MLPETMIAITLRYVAGGSILDLKNVYGVNRSWAYKIKDMVLLAIVNCDELKVSFPVHDGVAIYKICQGFASKSGLGLFLNCFLPAPFDPGAAASPFCRNFSAASGLSGRGHNLDG